MYDFYGKYLTGVVINQVNYTEYPSANHAVTHEIHAPALVDLMLFYQWIFNPAGQSSLSFAFSYNIQL
jgi:hypothetical protein